MKKSLFILIGALPILVYGQGGAVYDAANFWLNWAHYGEQAAHYAAQVNHINREIEHYQAQIKYYNQNIERLKKFDADEITTTLRGLLNTVDSSFDDMGRTYGGKRRNTARGKGPYKTIKDWEGHPLQRMPEELYRSKIATADSQMEAIQIASEYNEELRKRLVVDRDNLEHALRDVASATGQLQALQAAAKLAANQAVALQKMTMLLQLWMNMQIKRYTDQANKEAAQEAAWKKQTEFDPGDYIPQPMQLKI